MRVYTYTQARQNLSELLVLAETQEIVIQRRDGKAFVLNFKPISSSPFDIAGINTRATTKDLLDAVAETRKR